MPRKRTICGVVILTCLFLVLVLYGRGNIGTSRNRLEADIRAAEKMPDDWTVTGEVSDTMAAFISYPQDKGDHSFSIYVKRHGLSFGYFFRAGGTVVGVDQYIRGYTLEGYEEKAIISMNTQKVARIEIDDGNGIHMVDVDSTKPFAIILPVNAGNLTFYDVNGISVEYCEYPE